MLSTLNEDLARALASDRLDEAATRRRSRVEWAEVKPDPYESLTIRLARNADAPALRWLAQLDGRDLPPEPLLLAEAGHSLIAARSLATGQAVADPFRPTAHAVEMLELRSSHFRDASGGRRSRRRGRELLRAIAAPIRS